MKKAIEEAKKVTIDIPVGVVIKKNNKVLVSCHNLKEELKDTTAHAEILAIRQAEQILGRWRLEDCDMFVTLEPCPMCAGALVNSRIDKIYIGAKDPKTGACGSKLNLLQECEFDTSVEIENGILQEECQEILKAFFKEIRKIKKK